MGSQGHTYCLKCTGRNRTKAVKNAPIVPATHRRSLLWPLVPAQIPPHVRYATPPGRHRHPDPAAMDGTPRHRIDDGLPQGRSEQRRSGPNQQGEPRSIRVVVFGLRLERRFHGRVVLLVNAGEMVSAFAEENNLATIVGTKTPGRLLSGSAYKVGHGYILGLPVAAYLTWQGRTTSPTCFLPLSKTRVLSGFPQVQSIRLCRLLRSP